MTSSEAARRRLLLAGLTAAWWCPPARAFDRVAARDRYRDWLNRFHNDLTALANEVPKGAPATLADVERCCSGSVVPGSRGAHNVTEWYARALSENRGGWVLRAFQLMERSIPAGQGGLFPEAPQSGFPDRTLTVWYMHIHSGEALSPYFRNPQRFSPYRLPPDGQLERNAYPFLLFEDGAAGLRFGGAGKEWHGAVQFAYELQHL